MPTGSSDLLAFGHSGGKISMMTFLGIVSALAAFGAIVAIACIVLEKIEKGLDE